MQKNAKAYGATNIVACEFGCRLRLVQGYFKGSTDSWLQLFDAYALPANTTVPLRSWPIAATSPFQQTLDVPLVKGCVLCVSTTEATKTISAETADFFVDFDYPAAVLPSDLSTAGDYTTARSFLEVWAESAGPKRIFAIQGINGSGAALYLQVHCIDGAGISDAPALIRAVPAGENYLLDFGNGLFPNTLPGQKANLGCTVTLSETADVSTEPASATGITIKAFYQ